MSQQLIRVLGVDPGLTRCGVGVISGAPGTPLQLIGVGVILTPSTTALELRLLQLERELTQWVELHKPDVIAVERVFAQHNVRTVMGTGQAAGIALLVAAKAGIPVVMHTPSEVKAAVTGSGRANKIQVAEMVIEKANREIYKSSLLNSSFSKMGTTISLAIFDGEKIFTGHVGDSRIYFINDKKIIQINENM